MKRETAAKIVAQRKESALAAVKRESVEDTEEEDQQSKVVKTTASSNGNIGKAKGAGNSGKAANRAVKASLMEASGKFYSPSFAANTIVSSSSSPNPNRG